ncbi:MAG: hypothetical protein IT210_14660 [Armatimonadetes bacterium]|nr:hypothetical protein [Armatimonadota bacterium]
MYTHPFKSCAERLPLCLALAALPAAALANVGVPLIWATSGQLLLINIIIAMMVETVVAERLWGNLRHPFRLFLAANYFSTLSGSAFLATGGVWLWNVMIDEAPLYRAIPAA